MGLQKVAFNFMVERGGKLAKSLLCSKHIQKPINFEGLKYVFPLEKDVARSKPIYDTFRKGSELTFDDIYKVIKFGNGRIKFIPKIQQVNGKNIIPLEMPEYLYHITSEANFRKIQSSNKLIRSVNEQLQGVYLLDKENFLTRYLNVGNRKIDLCKSLLTHANSSNKNSSNLIVIKIPTENLARNGNIRFRTQEDFFYYQDKIIELQKGLKEKFSLRLLRDEKNRNKFEKYVLDNKFMTKAELDQFMCEMKAKIHQGYSLGHLGQLEKTKAIEYIYSRDICPSIIDGIQCRRFSINDCIDSTIGVINIKKLISIFN